MCVDNFLMCFSEQIYNVILWWCVKPILVLFRVRKMMNEIWTHLSVICTKHALEKSKVPWRIEGVIDVSSLNARIICRFIIFDEWFLQKVLNRILIMLNSMIMLNSWRGPINAILLLLSWISAIVVLHIAVDCH